MPLRLDFELSADWRLFAQKFQKEAIIRQMHEFKREKLTLEARLAELTKAAAHHDDHLRVIDAWFSQVCALVTL